jgi:pyruvate, water dikinase
MNMSKYTLFFNEATPADYDKLGGKGASLARMSNAEFPVPIGFSVTTDAYKEVLELSGLKDAVMQRLTDISYDDLTTLDPISAEIRQQIVQMNMPLDLQNAIKNDYRKLCFLTNSDDDLPVAVRSSANAEDLPDASFAGQQDTYLWIVGENAVVEHVKKCWASLFTSRAISYRRDHNIAEDSVLMSVVIQKMVNAKVAGVAMTLNPINGDRSKIVLDASWGLGEAVVSGEVTPDNFLVDKVMMEIVKSNISNKHIEHVPDREARCVVVKDITDDRANQACLTHLEVKQVCKMAKIVEKHYGCPQDIEWAIDADLPEGQNLTLLQSRPETVWSQKKTTPSVSSTPSFTFGMQGLVNSLINPIASKK